MPTPAWRHIYTDHGAVYIKTRKSTQSDIASSGKMSDKKIPLTHKNRKTFRPGFRQKTSKDKINLAAVPNWIPNWSCAQPIGRAGSRPGVIPPTLRYRASVRRSEKSSPAASAAGRGKG